MSNVIVSINIIEYSKIIHTNPESFKIYSILMAINNVCRNNYDDLYFV